MVAAGDVNDGSREEPPPPMPGGVVDVEHLHQVPDGNDSGSSRTAILFEMTAAVCPAWGSVGMEGGWRLLIFVFFFRCWFGCWC